VKPHDFNFRSFVKVSGLLSLLFLTACNFKQLKDSDSATDNSVAGLSGPPFSELKARVFTPYCVQCHAQYGNYSSVKREIGAIQLAVTEDRMPRNGNLLTPELKQLLNAWVLAGTPNQVIQTPEPVPTDLLLPTWESLYINIFAPKCVVCHNPNGQAKWIDVSTRTAMTQTLLKHIDFINPEESYLIERLRDPEEPMPPPPPQSNIPRLTEEEVSVVVQWIKDGLP
jgi:uncharacterized membrane protein